MQGTAKGQAIYTRALLRVYDWYVLGFTSRFVWNCPASVLLERYNRFASRSHLDIGVGTGYFLDKCRFPIPNPEISLLDLSPNSLTHCATRIERYSPRTLIADVMQPIELPHRHFESIAMNHLIHCIPGDVEGGKWRLFENVKVLLAPSGVLFGATVLGSGIPKNTAQRKLMDAYNRKGIFGNLQDSPDLLHGALNDHFRQVEFEQIGVVGLFSARDPIID